MSLLYQYDTCVVYNMHPHFCTCVVHVYGDSKHGLTQMQNTCTVCNSYIIAALTAWDSRHRYGITFL